MAPKWLIIKVVARNECIDKTHGVIGRLGLASHHLESLLGVIELIILCAFACIVYYFDVEMKETLLYKYGGLTYLFGKV